MEFACFPMESTDHDVGGRPSKFTKELLDKLAEAIALGMPDKFACERVNITEDTFENWKRTKPGFLGYINNAKAERMAKRIQRIDVGETGWQGTAWILERRWGEHFARPELQINMSVNATVEHTVNMIPEAELHRMLELTRDVETSVVINPDMPQPALTDTPTVEDPTNGSH